MYFFYAAHEQEAFKQERYELLFMDTWTDDELRSARDVLYPDISDTELNDRIYRYVIDGHDAASGFKTALVCSMHTVVSRDLLYVVRLGEEVHTLVTFSVCMVCLRNIDTAMCGSLFNLC